LGKNVVEIPVPDIKKGRNLFNILVSTRLCKSKSDARQMIAQGAIYVNWKRVNSFDRILNTEYWTI
jgi:tyrosyl-tRNA synthetase